MRSKSCSKALSLRRKLSQRAAIRDIMAQAAVWAARHSGIAKLTGAQIVDILQARKGKMDRAQWRRWYQVNRKRQRQLAAYKRLGPNIKLDPNGTGLPRTLIP